MLGVELAARFSIATNRLRYCGPSGADQVLYRVITQGDRLPQAREALGGFEALMPYLEALGRHAGKDPFDLEVVEAYWLGNRLLDDFSVSEFRALLEALTLRGLPRSVVRRLGARLPSRPLPHHLFHVCFVGVGEVTGHVESTLANLEECRPAWGTVQRVDGDRLTLSRSTVAVQDGQFRWGPDRSQVCMYDPLVLPDVQPGSTVVLHWGWPAVELDAGQAERLRAYSDLALQEANASRKAGP